MSRQIARNFSWYFLYQVLIVAIPLVMMPYVARVIGVEGAGTYAYTLAIAHYFVLFAMLGLGSHGNRAIAQVRGDREQISSLFWNLYTLQVLSTLLILLLYGLWLWFDRRQPLAVWQVIYVLSALFDINWLFFGLEQFRKVVIRNTVTKLLTLALVFVFVRQAEDLAAYTCIMALSFCLGNLALWPGLVGLVVWRRPSWRAIRPHVAPVWLLFVPILAVSVYRVFDKLMIGTLSTISELGLYDHAERINQVQINLATALAAVLLPRLSHLVAQGDDRAERALIRRAMPFILFLSIGLAAGYMAVADPFMPLFLGQPFARSALILTVLAPTGVLITWVVMIRSLILIPHHQERLYVQAILIGAAVNIVGNLILIPRFGAVGAAAGTLAAECVLVLVQTFLVRDRLEWRVFSRDAAVFLPAGLIMVVGVKMLGALPALSRLAPGLALAAQVVLGGSLYFGLILIWFTVLDRSRGRAIAASIKQFIRSEQ
jgi:O-antigen/teichoic acid export membrane protein